jgi:hypothetical protein
MSTDVSEVRAASIIRAMSVDIQLRTRQYIPEDSELHTRRRENLKFHILFANSEAPSETSYVLGYIFSYLVLTLENAIEEPLDHSS